MAIVYAGIHVDQLKRKCYLALSLSGYYASGKVWYFELFAN